MLGMTMYKLIRNVPSHISYRRKKNPWWDPWEFWTINHGWKENPKLQEYFKSGKVKTWRKSCGGMFGDYYDLEVIVGYD